MKKPVTCRKAVRPRLSPALVDPGTLWLILFIRADDLLLEISALAKSVYWRWHCRSNIASEGYAVQCLDDQQSGWPESFIAIAIQPRILKIWFWKQILRRLRR